MSVQTNGNGQIVKREKRPETTLAKMLEQMVPQMAKALPRHMTPDRMMRVTLTALRTTKDLAQCTPQSFIACVMTLSQLGLEPSNGLGFAYLIPRRNKKNGTVECTVILGYQGLMDLARRSGQIRSITAQAVYEGDEFEVSYGLSPKLRHVPNYSAPRTPAKLLGAYAVARVKDSDDPIFVYVPRVEIEGYRKRGASGIVLRDGSTISTPWDTDYEAMALKTAIRRLFRWLPKSVEMAVAARADEAPAASIVGASEVASEALASQGFDAAELGDGDEPTDAEIVEAPADVAKARADAIARGEDPDV